MPVIKNSSNEDIGIEIYKSRTDTAKLAFICHGISGYKEQDVILQVISSLKAQGYTIVSFDCRNSRGKSFNNHQCATITDFCDDLKTVIDVKCEDWKNESSMRKYLRPQTLFGDKFENYINQIPVNKSSSYSINHTNTDTPVVREISTTKVY